MTRSSCIYTKEELEQIADNINNKFFPERLLNAIQLDPYDLIDKLGCSVSWKYISPNDNILGMTFFDNGFWWIWSAGKLEKGMIPEKEVFSKGSIVINQVLLDTQKIQNENFVVAHELAHWIKDKEFFSNNPQSGTYHICKSNDFQNTFWNSRMSQLEIIEKQTNYLAAAILMPKTVLKREFFKLCRYKNIPDNPIEYKPFMKRQVAALAKIFNVNFNPVLYRLKDIGVFAKVG